MKKSKLIWMGLGKWSAIIRLLLTIFLVYMIYLETGIATIIFAVLVFIKIEIEEFRYRIKRAAAIYHIKSLDILSDMIKSYAEKRALYNYDHRKDMKN